MTVHGTAGNIVVNCLSDISVNHSSDIIVHSQAGNYSSLDIKIISDNNEDFDIYLQYTGSASAGTSFGARIERFLLKNETITFSPTATAYSGATFIHTATPGQIKWGQSGQSPNIYLGANKVFHEGNDGSGSGLDADTVDGIQGSQIWKKGADIGGSQNLNNYTTDGYYHQNSNANATSGSNYPANYAGMLSVVSDGVMVYQTYHQYNGNAYYHRSYYNGTWYNWRKVWTNGNDGSGSGLDADTVDGLQASQFLRSDTSDTMSGNLTVTGTGEFSGALKITETGTAQHLLIGNQDSGGTNKPAIVQGVNGYIRIGYGNSWSGEGGTFTPQMTFANGQVTFNSTNIYVPNIYVDGYIYHNGDTNTYIRFVGGDDFQIVSGGRQVLRMDEGTDPDKLELGDSATYTYTNGRIGINNSTPTQDLHVVGSALFGEAADVTYAAPIKIRNSADGFIGMVRSGIRTWAHNIGSDGHYYLRNVDGSSNDGFFCHGYYLMGVGVLIYQPVTMYLLSSPITMLPLWT